MQLAEVQAGLGRARTVLRRAGHAARERTRRGWHVTSVQSTRAARFTGRWAARAARATKRFTVLAARFTARWTARAARATWRLTVLAARFTARWAARATRATWRLTVLAARFTARWASRAARAMWRATLAFVLHTQAALRAFRAELPGLRTRLRREAKPLLLTFTVGGVALGLVLAIAIPGALLVTHAASYTPNPARLRPLSVPSTLYATDGVSLGSLGDEDRQPVTYSAIAPILVDAVVSTEDRTFWTNPGVDTAGLVRALVDDVSSGQEQEGGSTITEQLVKNRIMDPHHDLKKKVTEAVLALRLNQHLSKRQIMTQYLNTVYFGEGSYGIAAAAQRFFLTPVPGAVFPAVTQPKDLTLPDAALLAGMIANPSLFDPFNHPGAARTRRHEVLTGMVEQHYITPAQGAAANLAPLPTIPPGAPTLQPVDFWAAQVEQELLNDPALGPTAKDREELLLQGGLHITTTLDQQAQFYAQAAVNQILPNQPPFTSALISMDPTTGYVKAMVGGPGFNQLQYNIATHEPGRQPGSTYKVITLAAALEAGYSPNDTVDGTSPCTATRPGYPIWNTVNAEPGEGTMSLWAATAGSVNCAFAHVIASLGPPAVIDMAHRLGITGVVPNYLPITLGVADATPLEMATVISTIADQGVKHTPVFVEQVVGPDGHVYVDNTHPAGQRVLDPTVADCETAMLKGVITGGTGTAAQLPGRDAAGKTGTTDDHGDAWFIGFTPQVATAVWMGATTGEVPMTDVGGIEVFGGTYPARIWQAYTNAELAGQPAAPLPDPGPVCARPGASITNAGRGAPPPSGSPVTAATSNP